MKVIISHKSSNSRAVLDTNFSWIEDRLFCFLLADGKVRKYPMEHIWYIEFNEKDNKDVDIERRNK